MHTGSAHAHASFRLGAGCAAVLNTLGIMLRNPPAEARAATASLLFLRLACAGRARSAPDAHPRRCADVAPRGASAGRAKAAAVHGALSQIALLLGPLLTRLLARALTQTTEAFVDDSMRALCGSLALAQYRMCVSVSRQHTSLNTHAVFSAADPPPAWHVCLRARSVDGLLGERTWVEDPVPDYAPTPTPVSPRLTKLVRTCGA